MYGNFLVYLTVYEFSIYSENDINIILYIFLILIFFLNIGLYKIMYHILQFYEWQCKNHQQFFKPLYQQTDSTRDEEIMCILYSTNFETFKFKQINFDLSF